METLTFSDIQVFTSVWLPFGRSNMEALNRFVGSHKKYSSATEFGVDGVINDMAEGRISMKSHGVYLTPIEYDFTGFLKAHLRQKPGSEDGFGLYISKSGLTTLGIQLPEQENLALDDVKIVCGKLNFQFTDCVMPLLTDVQQSLVSSLYEVTNAKDIGYKLHSYSLVKCRMQEDKITDSATFLEKYASDIASLTDWVTHHTTIDGCHVFIGMAACLCVGESNAHIDRVLQHVMYLKACQKTAQRLHSFLWSLRRYIQQYRTDIGQSSGSYKVMKHTNERICLTNDNLSKVRVFDQLLRAETNDVFKDFEASSALGKSELYQKLRADFEHEIEKSENRDSTMEQLGEEVNVLSSELENRLELIMTKDNMQLNLILLILTVISILGVAEIQDFTREQWEIVVAFLVPFGIFILFYLRKFLKDYQFKNLDVR